MPIIMLHESYIYMFLKKTLNNQYFVRGFDKNILRIQCIDSGMYSAVASSVCLFFSCVKSSVCIVLSITCINCSVWQLHLYVDNLLTFVYRVFFFLDGY
jgi:hypothetical protein